MKKKRITSFINIGKLLEVEPEDIDRIAGGMIRLEQRYRSWPGYIKHSLMLAKNESECCLVWYFIGFKSGVMNAHSALLTPIGKEKNIFDDDPNIQ